MENKEYRPLIIPKITWDEETLTSTFGELIAQPLESGFGITIGNALRRVLLGGIEGCAVTSVIIKGANNEFAVLPGVVEDVMRIILNIKGIIIRNKEGRPGTMRLQMKGQGVARVADIRADDHLELVNGEYVLAHLGPDGELDIEFFVQSGRAYQPAQWPVGKAIQEDNRIYTDALFSPISKVSFDVEKTRVGKDIDYDKLILKVHTNGAEHPLDAFNYAVSVLRTQLECFLLNAEIPFNNISSNQEEVRPVKPQQQLEELGIKGISADMLLKPIEELELSVRAHNCLINAGIKRIVDLVRLPEDEVLKIKNFGRKSLNEVKDSLRAFSLNFGMDIKEADLKKLLLMHGDKESE